MTVVTGPLSRNDRRNWSTDESLNKWPLRGKGQDPLRVENEHMLECITIK